MVSHTKGNKYFNPNLNLLERISNKHYLLFEDDQMMPKLATLKESTDVSSDTFKMIQNLEFVSIEMHSNINNLETSSALQKRRLKSTKPQ